MTCLAFVTTTLYLLVQPRPKSVIDAKNVNQRGSKRVTSCCYDWELDGVGGGIFGNSVYPGSTRGNKRVGEGCLHFQIFYFFMI